MTVYRNVPLSALPQGHYGAILADPPWRFLTRSDKGLGRSADRHYDTMSIDEIKALPVRDVCRKDAALLMWVIDTHVEMAFGVMQAWGFNYKTVGLYWAKTSKDGMTFPIGTGYWTRANPEHAILGELEPGEQEIERNLLATTGAPKRIERDVKRLLISPRREHSRKPDETYERVERLLPGPYLEMFSRTNRPSWDVWGHEAGIFNRDLLMLIGDPEDADFNHLIGSPA